MTTFFNDIESHSSIPGIFCVYFMGHLWAPVPMQNNLIFPNLIKKSQMI